MDQLKRNETQMQPQAKTQQRLQNQSSSPFQSQSKEEYEDKIPRRPGRPPLRIKNRMKRPSNNSQQDIQNDQDFQTQKPKIRQRVAQNKEQKQNNLQGFLKIIDYLKKIQCDETSLHNKMNPYNLMTPICFWYMISSEYFSFDFFSNKNPQQIALQFLKKAQKTQIILPLRFLKPVKTSLQLQFQTKELKDLSVPVTQKLISLTNFISLPQLSIQNVQKSSSLTSVAQDNNFRSSTRAIIFNWIKRKIRTSEKWSNCLKIKLDSDMSITSKQFKSKVYQCQSQVKHQQLNAAPEMFGRLPRNKKQNNQIKQKVNKKVNIRQKKSKKPYVDEIYDQSESEQKDKNQMHDHQLQQQNNEIDSQSSSQQAHKKQQKLQQDIKIEGNYPTDLGNQNCNNIKNKNQNQEINSEQINEVEQEHNKQYDYVITTKSYNQDDILLESILHMPLDNAILILKAAIDQPKLPFIQKPFMPFPKNDPLQLVYQIHPQQEVFLNYMRERQQKIYMEKTSHSQYMIQEKEREGQVQDAKCQVCTDGDYTQDNLIVFCSMCNISLHQRCVGLAKVPADNWICQVCASFGPSGINVPCPLCRVKGGALKRTSIHINTPLFKDTNPQYNEFAKKCPNYKHKEQYVHSKTGKQEDSYYDYFSKATYPTDQPVCHFVWVHYVCAIWIPQCYFQQKNGLINIKGIQNIDKKRFRQKCLICKESRAGACIKCDNEKCFKFYHPQCARKKKIYMQQLNLDKLKYLIFCEAHQPLKVKRKIDIKKKKQRDQIVKFCRGIEKYVQTYKIANLPFKLLKINTGSMTDLNKIEQKKDKCQITDQKTTLKLQKNSDQQFIKTIIEGLNKQNQIIVNLTCIGSNKFKVEEIMKPSKRDMKKSLTRIDQYWKKFKNNQTPQNNLKRFNTIMRENNYLKQKIQNFINFGGDSTEMIKNDKKIMKRGSGRRRRQKIETVIQQQGALFCVCRRPYNGENDMFECEVCNEWYHHQCIGFIGSEEDAQKLDFHCMKCLKYEPSQSKKELLDKCSRFFSQDSLFLNYRPPTPSLQSEQEEQKKNINDYKGFTVEIQSLQKSKSKQINMQYENKYSWISDQKINLQQPFMIFQNGNKIEKSQKKVNTQKFDDQKMEQDSPKFKIRQTLNNQNQSINQQNRIIINQTGKYFQPNVLNIAQSPSNTPQFRHSTFSFSDQMHQKRKVVNQKQANSRQEQNIQNQQDEIQDQSNGSYNMNFQFNRDEVIRFKNAIQQEQQKEIVKETNQN